jgi:predicted ribosomally synthesized peptide with SipW-like signal peptide
VNIRAKLVHISETLTKMNKKILVSLSVIAAVAAIAIGGTVAYFSDTETSTGNTFTAGSIDLKVDSTCHYNGFVCQLNPTNNRYQWYNPQTSSYDGDCSCTWLTKDLNGDVFFNFNDVKPGDNGEDTISFNLTSNPAWACAYVSRIVDSDNGCNEPEKAAEPACTENGDGELDENTYITAWVDNNCNNILDTNEEIFANNIKLSDFLRAGVIPVADSQHGPALQPGNYCIGIKWNVPTTTGNEVQTDKVGADLSFYVEQARNNPNFVCGPR